MLSANSIIMSVFYLIIHVIWVLFLSLSLCCFMVMGCSSWCPYQIFQHGNRRPDLKTERFWEFSEQNKRWVEVKLPFDLVSCADGDCSKMGSIFQTVKNSHESLVIEHNSHEQKRRRVVGEDNKHKSSSNMEAEKPYEVVVLPQRKRISLTRMSETSVWVTGESGCIYERFWNGIEWVIAPHDFHVSAGRAVMTFVINQTILALSEAGNLYQHMQVQLGESPQAVWIETTPKLNQITDTDLKNNPSILMKFGVLSHDRQRAYFCTKNGTLVEFVCVEPSRWINHGQPAGSNVAAIAGTASTKEVVYTISSSGDLYEYDRKSKPSWKKHIWQERTAQVAPLMPSRGYSLHGLNSDHSESLFLLTKEGTLVERRLHKRKWKWIVHGSPQHHNLTSITPTQQDDKLSETSISLFFTTSSGSVFEYRIPRQFGIAPNNRYPGTWESHQHPLHAKVARGIPGLQLHAGRILFPLDDGRLAELHLPGLGGDVSGPSQNFRRKTSSTKYIWFIVDAPESEGWNAEICTEERGPKNCFTGTKDESHDSITGRRKQDQSHNSYLSLSSSNGGLIQSSEECNDVPDEWITSNFRMRVMYEGKSFFLVTNDGLIFEYLCTDSVWIWLRHESSTAMKGILGSYNGTLFMVDTHGSLLLRERNGNELVWNNCTAMRKGKTVVGAQPWDGLSGLQRKVTIEDSLFFVSKDGRLLKLIVSMRKFKWKDCRNPPEVKVACIVDQELFRENIVFVIGRNGHLYQYNKVTDLWHEHYHSQYLILSKFPGTVIRPSSSSTSLSGSLFMLSVEGGLVEYQWNSQYGWNWVEHGTPNKGVTLVGSPGPSFGGNQILLIGSDGKVYLRYMEKKTSWKWKDFGYPSVANKVVKENIHIAVKDHHEKVDCVNSDFGPFLKDKKSGALNIKCDPKVASTRPIPFSADSVIFELRDNRLAEIKQVEETEWVWSRIIGTPTSLCFENYWPSVPY